MNEIGAKAINLRTFYGDPGKNASNISKKRKCDQYLQSSYSNGWRSKIPKQYKPSILGPSYCWKTFYRQKEAFDFLDRSNEDLCVFAYEKLSLDGRDTGQRIYLVTSTPVFWHYYSQLTPGQRRHYEIIPEDHPCHLYFDLEFPKQTNPQADGPNMVDILIQYVSSWLELVFKLPCDRSMVLDLDASTNSKFSRHLVFHLDNSVFKDNVQAGHFVKHIFSVLLKFLEKHNCLKSSDVVQERKNTENEDGSTGFERKDSFDDEISKYDDKVLPIKTYQNKSIGFSAKDSFDDSISMCHDDFFNPKMMEENYFEKENVYEKESKAYSKSPAFPNNDTKYDNMCKTSFSINDHFRTNMYATHDNQICDNLVSQQSVIDLQGIKYTTLKTEVNANSLNKLNLVKDSFVIKQSNRSINESYDKSSCNKALYCTNKDAHEDSFSNENSSYSDGFLTHNYVNHSRYLANKRNNRNISTTSNNRNSFETNCDKNHKLVSCSKKTSLNASETNNMTFMLKDSFDEEVSLCDEFFFKDSDKQSKNTKNSYLKNEDAINRMPVHSHESSLDNGALKINSNLSFETGLIQGDIDALINRFSLSDLQSLIIRDKDRRQTLFADLAVYTRNRNFRLFLSSKSNKNNPLLLSPHNNFFIKERAGNSEENIFFASLISNINPAKETKLLHFESQGTAIGSTSISYKDILAHKKTSSTKKDQNLQGWGKGSPFMEIDTFFASLVEGSECGGSIRRWRHYPGSGTLIYDIQGYRYCARVGRQHRSNNIYYVVDLHRAVYCQRCHDPDCQSYQSNDIPLPPHCLPWNLLSDEWGEEDVKDDKGEEIKEVIVTEIENGTS